ncbi:glycosyltransferase family 4 protein [Xenorhabdus hominickii]|uniref:Glycosyl transferase family 1 n=1 Tax=Xenorhabdus hominickii TaxID=351679 RepID=A0A2G0QER4_XENHO|nr:glycosyltransferase family 4 protein [Xenorhabdus hominickii]AOM41758.1 glycosyl transferase family 1 [Xenorhabdus hominickii]PHM57717.1 glycosyltransferase [Xenorhabdus hominickii]
MTKKTLNILHTESSCGWGGQEIRILTESQGMMQRGHHVVIVCCPTSTLHREAHHYGVPVVALPIEKKRLPCLRAMRHWLKKEGRQFDVINTHSSTDSWLVAAACATLKGMPPIVRTRHVSTHVSKSVATRWLYLNACQHIVTTGEKLRQYLHTYNDYPLSHMTSVPTGIDLTRFCPENKQQNRQRIGIKDKPTLGIVATMRTWKGHRYLLDSWKILHQRYPDWQLLFVGDGPQRKNLEPRVQREGLTESVVFLGNRQDVPDCLNAMDIFALPSFGNEGVPQGIMQAMACGLPVVSTSVGAITEAVVDGETGYIIEPKSVEQLTEKLDLLIKDTELRLYMGDVSLKRATHLFGMNNMLEKMESIFYRSMESKR